jgi:hypothetical protein
MTTMMLAAAGSAAPIQPTPEARPAATPGPATEDADGFLAPVLDCFPLARRAVLLLLGGVWALDVCAVLAQGLEPAGAGSRPDARASAALWVGLAGLALVGAAAGLLASIQVRYTFEHAATRRRHFYELKLARFHEGCAALKSLSVRDAVDGVRTLHALRKEIGGLDRRLVVEALTLSRRMRDLVWAARAAAVMGLILALAVTAATDGRVGLLGTAVPLAVLLAALAIYLAVELWVRERMARAAELLATAPGDLAAAFDPSPHLEAAVERLLTRLNRHFDRLKGPAAEVVELDGELFL